MNYKIHAYEFIGTDPFYHGATADIHALKRERMAELRSKPVVLEPILNLLFAGVYKLYWTLFMCIVWIGYAVGENLRKLYN